MTQNKKICLNFETGEEVKNVMISLDNSILKWTSREFDEDFRKSEDSDPIFQKYPLLLELEKKLGFDVYGVYSEYIILEKDKDFYLSNDFRLNIIGIIQELSKHYRGEENKFEEFRNILHI